MGSEVEYFYGEALRWSFGFDNPNKAAVLFACALPLLWYGWHVSWRIKKLWLRVPALLAAAGLMGTTWYCLIMTYSRGGLVAAVAALGFLLFHALWRERSALRDCLRSAYAWLSVFLLTAMLGAVIWNGLGSRSVEVLENDRSVGNRIELWGNALQMAAENPKGFGAGKSGEQYMQWYQPTDQDRGYRTMVNSYLTFLVERGWGVSLLALLGFVMFWNWTRAQNGQVLPLALRASLIAFLTAGFFSTTMEEGRLWILPACVIALMIMLAACQRSGLERRNLVLGLGLGLSSCFALWLFGFSKSQADPLLREFGQSGIVALAPRKSAWKKIGSLVDERIVGSQFEKLLREMAMEGEMQIVLGDAAKVQDEVLLMGKGIEEWEKIRAKRIWLLAPEMVSDAQVNLLKESEAKLALILPEIDEDGRVEFWESIAEDIGIDEVNVHYLTGVGCRVDWAFSELIEIVQKPKIK